MDYSINLAITAFQRACTVRHSVHRYFLNCLKVETIQRLSAFMMVALLLMQTSIWSAPIVLAQVSPPLQVQNAQTGMPTGTLTISGLVSEEGSAEAVVGVSVLLCADSSAKTILRGTRTNKFGFYSLPAVSARAQLFLVVRGIGYVSSVRVLSLTGAESSLKLNIVLKSTSVRGQEVTVQADRSVGQVSSRSISSIDISPELLKKLPALGGEVDVFRALQLTPGVKSASEISSGLYVRGGSPDQNLTLLDGVPLYNPSHLGGLLSVFNNDALKDIKLVKGGFPAEYGGRISSVVDVVMREGSRERLKGNVGISLLSARLTLEGPLQLSSDTTPAKGSFMLSGRRMYLDALRAVLSDTLRRQIPGYYFYDFNAKLNYDLSDNDKLFVSGYAGYDVLNQPDALDARFAVTWGNATANLRWMHIVSPSLFTNFSVQFTNYDFSTSIATTSALGEAQGFSSLSRIRDWMLRTEAQWFPLADHTVKTGVEATYHTFLSAAETNARFGAGAFRLDSTGGTTVQSLEAAYFLQDEWQQAFGVEGLTVNAGGRVVFFERGRYFLLEPRASASYQLADDVSLRGAFAVANQFVHLIIRNDLGVPSDVWFPSTENILPARGTQYTVGVDTKLWSNECSFSVEGYYKSFQNVYEFRDDAQFSLLAPLESQFTRGTGEAYGVEFFLNKNGGKEWLPKLTGWIGYTLSWVWRTFPDLNSGLPFPPRFDRRHDISLVASYKIDEQWELGLSWVYATGQAFTMPASQFDFVPLTNGRVPGGTPRPRFQSTERNAFRLPAFHKLDVSLTHSFRWFDLPFQASLSVYNAYNRANAFSWSIRYRTEVTPDGRTVQTPFVEQLSLFPIIPTLGLSCSF
jgi:hypothetical protein